MGKFEGDGELGQYRREFIGALGGALGIALVSDPIELASAAGKGGGGKGGRGRSRIPSGYVFHRVFTAGQHLPGLDDIAEILPGVMINDRSEIIFHATTKAGTRKVPEFGSGNYGLVGNDQASARPHVTIAVPFATTETLKLPSKPTPTGAWIMNAGTSAAHLMVPGH